MLVGTQPVGTPLLVHLDAAVRVLEEAEAALIERAVAGLEAAGRGEDPEGYFDDLVNREPSLPPHLAPGGHR